MIHCLADTVVLCQWNFLGKKCPLKISGDPPARAQGKPVHQEVFHWRHFIMKLPDGVQATGTMATESGTAEACPRELNVGRLGTQQ